MRFFVLTFCLLACACGPHSGIQTKLVSPVTASTVEPPKPVTTDSECRNIGGIEGLAEISFDGGTVLNFYERPDATESPAQTLRFYDDKELKMFKFRAEGKKSYNLLDPKAHKLDYFLFDLEVINRRRGWLQVIVDDETNETLWLPENKSVKFESWLQNMKNSFAVGVINSSDNPLRVRPDATAKKISFNKGEDSFRVLEMKGEWIKVTLQNRSGHEARQSVSGWFRWRDEAGCLLVEIFPFA